MTLKTSNPSSDNDFSFKKLHLALLVNTVLAVQSFGDISTTANGLSFLNVDGL